MYILFSLGLMSFCFQTSLAFYTLQQADSVTFRNVLHRTENNLTCKCWFMCCQDSSLSWQGTVCYNWSEIASLYMWISVPLLCLRGKLWDRKHHCGFGRGSRLFSFLWAVTSSDTVEKSFSLDFLCSEPCLLVCGSLPLKRTLRNYGWKVSPSFHVLLMRCVGLFLGLIWRNKLFMSCMLWCHFE